MRILTTVAAIALALLPISASAQGGDDRPFALAEAFLRGLKDGKTEQALKELGASSKLLGAKLAAEPLFASQIENSVKLYGPVKSWEKIESDTLGSAVRRDIYLVRHRDMVMRWRFYFIQTEQGWVVGSFEFEDQLPSWFN